MKTYSRKNSSYLKKAFIASNFNEMCRLCLSELDLGLTPIFQEFSKFSYQEWIQYSVDVLIEEGDGLPPNICEECLAMVEQIYLFKKKCKASDSKLREHLELVELDEEGKLNEIRFSDASEDHKNLFKREEQSQGKSDESSAVDSGGTACESMMPESKEILEENINYEAVEGKITVQATCLDSEPQGKVVINKVKRYILKGEKRDDDQEEDLTVCEVVPLEVRNEDLSPDSPTYTTLECVGQNGDTPLKIQEIYRLWENEEEADTEQELTNKEQPVLVVNVSRDTEKKSENVGISSPERKRENVIRLVYSVKNSGETEKTYGKKPGSGISFKCFACGKNFDTGLQLRSHLAKFHREVADAAFCETCGKSFVCVNNLKRHMGIHTGYKPHKCKICGRRFSQASILKRHVFTHETQKPFNCQICGKGYTQKMNLVSHFKNHGPRTEGEAFTCRHCKKSFVHQSGLSRHLKLHQGIRFSCEQCGKTFNDSSALARHVKVIHTRKT